MNIKISGTTIVCLLIAQPFLVKAQGANRFQEIDQLKTARPSDFISFPFITIFHFSSLSQIVTPQKDLRKDSVLEQSLMKVSDEAIKTIHERVSKLDEKVNTTTNKVLKRYQKQYDKIIKRIARIDSIAANKMTIDAASQKAELSLMLEQHQYSAQYLPYLDTLKTAMKFIENSKKSIQDLSPQNVLQNNVVSNTVLKISDFESQLQKAEVVKHYLLEQQRKLYQELNRLDFIKQYKQINKFTYYYGEQIKEYREVLKHPERLERKAIEAIKRTSQFQDFMKHNSILAAMFQMPDAGASIFSVTESMPGLQSRAQVNQFIQSKIVAGGNNSLQQIQANSQQAHDVFQQLKDKANHLVGDEAGTEMPVFKPNMEKTKSFSNRIEYGINLQSQRPKGIFPVTSDIGITIGYRLNEKSLLGIGVSYRLGLGQDLSHMQITHQGAGLRSFLDFKIKSTVWISGGIEFNYNSIFNSLEQLKGLSAWQKSGLIGLSKKMPFNSKLLKNSKVQILWDFLSSYQVPKTQPIVFRIGYSIK